MRLHKCRIGDRPENPVRAWKFLRNSFEIPEFGDGGAALQLAGPGRPWWAALSPKRAARFALGSGPASVYSVIILICRIFHASSHPEKRPQALRHWAVGRRAGQPVLAYVPIRCYGYGFASQPRRWLRQRHDLVTSDPRTPTHRSSRARRRPSEGPVVAQTLSSRSSARSSRMMPHGVVPIPRTKRTREPSRNQILRCMS
jgi:hypothetical protein